MKFIKPLFVVGIIIVVFGFKSIPDKPPKDNEIRNIILMIPDGTSESVLTLARWYKNYDKMVMLKTAADLDNFNFEPLAIDSLLCAYVRTYSIDAPIGESAAAATAFATGYKTQAGRISVSQSSLDDIINKGKLLTTKDKIFPKDNAEIPTVLEAAQKAGKSTGLVVTCILPHATPAAFASHSFKRDSFNIIAKQEIDHNIDVVFGGGKMFFDGRSNRQDKLVLTDILKKENYDIIYDTDGLKNIKKNKVWGLFAEMDMAFDIDRDSNKEPSIAEMTETAIKILSKNSKGFFLMVEGSKVDFACHSNDPVGAVTEYLAFDKAVQKAIEFAKKDKHTVVIICPDHGNGGLSIGNSFSVTNDENKYDKLSIQKIIKPLKDAKHTAKGIDNILYAEYLKNAKLDKAFINTTLSEYSSDLSKATDISKSMEDYIINKNKYINSVKSNYDCLHYAYNSSIDNILGPVISKQSYLGWTTQGHTGEDVFLAIYHPNNKTMKGLIDNTDIGKYIFKVISNK